MGLFKLSALLCLVSQAYSEDALNEVQAAFESNNIVPTIIDTAPTKLLNVKYGNLVVNLGNELPVTSVASEPTFEWDANPESYYTIAMVGYPEEPERNLEITKSVKHMLLINILGSDVSSGNYLAPYLQPLPPPLGGSQRYTFLLYKQANQIQGKYSLLDRFNFDLPEFVKANDLTVESGNFFKTSLSTLLKNPLSILGK